MDGPSWVSIITAKVSLYGSENLSCNRMIEAQSVHVLYIFLCFFPIDVLAGVNVKIDSSELRKTEIPGLERPSSEGLSLAGPKFHFYRNYLVLELLLSVMLLGVEVERTA